MHLFHDHKFNNNFIFNKKEFKKGRKKCIDVFRDLKKKEVDKRKKKERIVIQEGNRIKKVKNYTCQMCGFH